MIRALVILLLLTVSAQAEEKVIASLSQNRVAITTDFSGSEIFVYGAIQRSRLPNESDDKLEVIIVIEGPSGPVIVREKERRLGIWVNTKAEIIDQAPSFYAVASTGPLSEILSDIADTQNAITVVNRIHIAPGEDKVDSPQVYREAIIRLGRSRGVFFEREGEVELIGRTLFQTNMKLPANIVEGDYTARVFLLRSGNVLDDFQTAIRVRKVGLERWIYTLAHENSLIYGILSILVALLAGWGASEAFRLLRR